MPTDAAFFTVELILMTVGAEALLGQECFTCGTRKGNVLKLWKSVDSPRSLRAPLPECTTELMTLGLPPSGRQFPSCTEAEASPRTSSFV
jgi:hypothetical protein